MLPRYVRFLHDAIKDEVFTRDPEGTLKLLKRLRSGGLVDIHLDGVLTKEAVRLPIFGVPRKVPAGFLRIAKLAGSPLIAMRCLGDSRRLMIGFEEPVEIGQASHEELIRTVLPGMVTVLEAQIREHPEEYETWSRI